MSADLIANESGNKLKNNIDHLVELALLDAVQKSPAESCGLIIDGGDDLRYIACRNISHVGDQFAIDEKDYYEAEDQGQVLCIVHSHPTTRPEPSIGDLVGIEKTQLPWLIVNPLTNEFTFNDPSGFVLPLIGREFIHGIVDCLTIIQDVYKMIGIEMPDYERDNNWWNAGKNHYLDRFEECGFYLPDDQKKLQNFDVVLMQVQSPVPNHAGVFLDNYLIHHCGGRLSCRAVYGGIWQQGTTHILRHHEKDSVIRSLSEKVRKELHP